MKVSVAALWICVLLLGACGGGGGGDNDVPPVFETHTLQPGPWVVMGSSTAAGAGASPGNSWAELLQGEILDKGAEVVNIARGGSVTYEGLSATSAPVSGRPLPDPSSNIDQALSRDPGLVILAYPTNDTAVGYSAGETVANLLAMRAMAAANTVPVIVLSTQPRNLSPARLATLQDIDEQLSKRVGPCFVPVRERLAAENGHLAERFDFGDGVHLNDEGHALIGEQIRAVLDEGKCVVWPTSVGDTVGGT